HTQDIPAFLRREQKQPGYLKEDQIEYCLAGWRSVLAEHPGVFDEGILTDTAAKINEIIGWHHEEEQVLSHGDFHWDNLLLDENGDVVICDWQGVNAGGASGDISFFLSRLGADGINIEPERVVKLYCQERFQRTGENISKEDMIRHMNAANVITSFQFWHQYLHGSACERVRGIYEKMRME
ncbi:MAG: phosphotransferase, partial [Acetatifactor sp.]|nr:phosphotransferase [Acetatifactor sp.]